MTDDRPITPMLPAREVPCPHCGGTGQATIPADVETVSCLYFGCVHEAGHGWFSRHLLSAAADGRLVQPALGRHVDTGFAPGMSVGGPHDKRIFPEVEGDAALHHLPGGSWTVLSYWDRSVDSRPGSHSTFVAAGKHSYATMVAIIEAQFPSIWARKRRPLRLVTQPPVHAPAPR